MDLPHSRSAILLITVIGWTTKVLVKGEFIPMLNINYQCGQSLETVVNLSAYNLSCDELNASINNKTVIDSNSVAPPIINSVPGKNFTIRGCHTIEYMCVPNEKSDHTEKRLIIKGIKNHINNTDKGIRDSGGHLTDGIENHKNNTNEDKTSSRNHYILGIIGGFIIFIVLGLVIVAKRGKIRCWFRSCRQQEKFSGSLSASPEVI